MKPIRAVSCWGNEASPLEALDLAVEWGFEAVEARLAGSFATAAHDVGKQIIAEIVTGCDPGAYVPGAMISPQAHLDDFQRQLDEALACDPLRISVLAGSDLWDFSSSCRFFARLLEIAARAGAAICVETHRSRPTFHPVRTMELLSEFPDLTLTLDVSHWCVVCERLVAAETGMFERILPRVGHLHARVGYDQGPQVPDPRAARYTREAEAHFSLWDAVAMHHRSLGAADFTITPEFGPDGYLQSHPATGIPAANLRELNRWMGTEIARRWPGKV